MFRQLGRDVVLTFEILSFWIGAFCIILAGVKVGEGSVIAVGSVVTNDIPPKSIARGNPAKVVGKIG